ncbi:hypothetical protein Csa_008016 [Cucumis sativus]|uniref:Uncharacterized protein n=1 Tax=Cucumis sativus TaxID=3659 RepID=A0A0A0KQK6_CUCSA|nr:hypothetical protein Csa_008016 [Cucumis sativus]
MNSGITGFLLAAEIRGFEGPPPPFVVVLADTVRSTSDILTFSAMSIRRKICCDSPEAPLRGSVVIGRGLWSEAAPMYFNFARDYHFNFSTNLIYQRGSVNWRSARFGSLATGPIGWFDSNFGSA